MNNPLDTFWSDGVPPISEAPPGDLLQIATTLPDKVIDTLLPELMMTHAEAKECDKRIEGKWHEFYRELITMRDREGWKALGFLSWDKYLRAKAEKLGLDHSTLTRRIQAGTVREEIAEQGVSVRNMADSHARELDRLDTPEKKAEAWKLAQELSQQNPPSGKAAEFYHPGKVYTEYVRTAVETLLPPEDDEEADPFNPNTRHRVEHKPLPPTVPLVTDPDDDKWELADYRFADYRPHAEVVFVRFCFEDGRTGETWVPVGVWKEVAESLK